MLLPRFALHTPSSLAEAIELLARHGDDATVYAGGTELLLAMKLGILGYGHLVDVKRIPGLAEVTVDADGSLGIGALATHHMLEHHPLLARHLAPYAALSRTVGNIRVRVAGTLGGNLCFAEPHADPPAFLAAVGARVTLAGPGGEREVAAADFIVGAFDTVRRPDEILTRITIPRGPASRRVAYERFGHLERPTAGAAAALTMSADGRVIEGASVWVGSVTPRPSPMTAVTGRLAGLPVAALGDVLAAASAADAEALSIDGDLHGSEDYKRHLVQVLVERAVWRAAAVPRRERGAA
ncbi:MAG TPA: FAD binding domain-containing protein [Candidatus Limnocylindria bacterium]|nr:FAD binding domain-containing protein [Candidatus Limnocylindria bacterium]